MMNALKETWRGTKPSRSQLRRFGTLFAVLFGLVAAWAWYRDAQALLLFFGITAAHFVGFTLLAPIFLVPLFRAWMMFAAALNWVMTRLILSALYFLVITPMGLVGRLFGKRFLDMRFRTPEQTYWQARRSSPDRARYEQQY